MISEFHIGLHYTNDEIGISLRVANLGGIRPSVNGGRNMNYIAIMTHLYPQSGIREGARKILCPKALSAHPGGAPGLVCHVRL